MKIKLPFLFVCTIMSFVCFSQNTEKTKAKIQVITPQNISQYLKQNLIYPKNGNRPAGDCTLVLELTIEKNGELSNIKNISSCDKKYFDATLLALGKLNQPLWSPKVVGDSTVKSNKLLVVEFRKFMNEMPVDYLQRAKKQFKKENYKKAIKRINNGIEEHPYNSQYYLYRSLANQKLGQKEQAVKDRKKAEELQEKVFGIITIDIVGVSRTRSRTISY